MQVGGMPRTTRIYAPGVGYHVIAVTQDRREWLVDDVAELITHDIDEAGSASGHRILARVVMPTHFHIIIKHAATPLGWMMQRVMQRAATRIATKHSHEGHVFQARYWAEPIPTPTYLRRAIVYTHENPCAKNICASPAQFPWSSHREYLRLAHDVVHDDVGFRDGLMLFANDSMETSAAVENYLRFIEFCETQRRNRVPGDWLLPGSLSFAKAPAAAMGDNFWVKTYSQFEGNRERPAKVANVRDLAIGLLLKIDSSITLDMVRFAGPKSVLSEPRRQLACALTSAGCRPCQICRLLNLSPSYVSKLRRAMFFPAVRH